MFKLFISFFKIGLFTFGGGQAMLPLLEKEMSLFNLTLTETADLFALAQTLPGIVALNSAVLVGYRLGKSSFALVAVLAVALPSFILMLLVAYFLQSYLNLSPVQSAFSGVRLATATLILYSAFRLLLGCLFYLKSFEKGLALQPLPATIFVVTLIMLAFGLNPFIMIGLNLLLSLLLYRRRKK